MKTETTHQQVVRLQESSLAYAAAAEALHTLAREHPVIARHLDDQAESFERSAASNRSMRDRRLSGR